VKQEITAFGAPGLQYFYGSALSQGAGGRVKIEYSVQYRIHLEQVVNGKEKDGGENYPYHSQAEGDSSS
jgi:hypothetical protein